MQKKWVIEFKADFDDKSHSEAMDELVRNLAVQGQAAALLLKGTQQPQTVCYADDFMVGRTEIDLMAKALPKQNATDQPETEVSDELMESLRAMGKQ